MERAGLCREASPSGVQGTCARRRMVTARCGAPRSLAQQQDPAPRDAQVLLNRGGATALTGLRLPGIFLPAGLSLSIFLPGFVRFN